MVVFTLGILHFVFLWNYHCQEIVELQKKRANTVENDGKYRKQSSGRYPQE
jgi:hypothetical protein